LLGSGVTANYYFPNLATLLNGDTRVVGAGVEWTDPTGYPGDFEAFDSIDIGDTSIFFDYRSDACCQWTSADFNGFEFIFDAGRFDDLTSVAFAPNSNGYVDSMLSVVDDTLFVDWQGGDISGVESVEISFSFDSEAVPAPATVSLLALGLLGLARRRRD
jgi:hypothetical protein